MDNACGNAGGENFGRFTKPIASTMFGHQVYLLDGTWSSVEVSAPHEEFFKSAFGICIGGKQFSDGCCTPNMMHAVCRSLGIEQHRVK